MPQWLNDWALWLGGDGGCAVAVFEEDAVGVAVPVRSAALVVVVDVVVVGGGPGGTTRCTGGGTRALPPHTTA